MSGCKYIKNVRVLAVAALAALACASCVTARRVNYLQDMTQGSQIELENRFEAVLVPYDELYISVTSSNPELAQPFNNVRQGMAVGAQGSTYLVDIDGNIQFPILGNIHVAGLTRLRLQDTLATMLKMNGQLDDPFVTARFVQFKIFFLGANGGKVINVPNERCTFLEALAMSGDLGLYTRRDHIAVMREVDGKMVMRYLDPRSSDVFNDPFYMLQQNDFIITESLDNGTVRSEVSYWLGWVSTAVSIVSLATTLLLYRSMSN